jgi:hypothetical protein
VNGGNVGRTALIELVFLALLFLMITAWVRIFRKAGYSGFLGLALLIPIVNLAVLLWLGSSDWPTLRELERLRHWKGSAP